MRNELQRVYNAIQVQHILSIQKIVLGVICALSTWYIRGELTENKFVRNTGLSHDPLIVVVLMVKNEAPVMRTTLESYINCGMDAFLIFDTGSTDMTIAETEKCFFDHGIHTYYIRQEPFIDFATSRNRALDLAEELFPQACFMLMPDAEWHIHGGNNLLRFGRDREIDTQHHAYFIRIVLDNTCDFATTRLIRIGYAVRFAGAIHEAICCAEQDKVPTDIFFEMCSTPYGSEKSRQRWKRDLDILLKEYDMDPYSPRTLFYLAQTYACLGDWEHAKIFYEKRIEVFGWDEENYMARFRLAQAYGQLNEWDKAVVHYLAAFSMRPTRAESLINLAQHFWDTGEHALCYLFARRAVEIPYPATDLLFVEKEAYDLTRHDLLGRAAWYVGEYALSEEEVRKALKIRPDAWHLKFNWALLQERKKA